MLNSSCRRNLVEATELPKQQNTWKLVSRVTVDQNEN
jgi:hypothetical protein